MAIELVLFDLDNTLLRTDDLEPFRGIANLTPVQPQYDQRLTAAYHQGWNRASYTRRDLDGLREQFINIKLGVFTRSPRRYAQVVLQLAYPGFLWDVLISFQDVARSKPSGDGIRSAMDNCQVQDPRNVLMVGDNLSDVLAAYDAGCWAVLDKSCWPMSPEYENWEALKRMPDAVIRNPSHLAYVLNAPQNYLPELERALMVQAPREDGRERFEKTGYFNPLQPDVRTPVNIHYMGRHFSQEAYQRCSWHELTHEIHRLKDTLEFPYYWIATIRKFLQRQPAVVFGNDLIVTVIPAKQGRLSRLESMLMQLAESHRIDPIGDSSIEFLPGLLTYLPGAQSHHSAHLNRQQRFENVRDYLRVVPGQGHIGKQIVVIDDVVTSGASLIYARMYLIAAGASDVTCLSMTKAINSQ